MRKSKKAAVTAKPAEKPLYDEELDALIAFQRRDLEQTSADKPGEVEERLARSLDDLAAYDALFRGMLGTLRKDIQSGLDAESIMRKYSSLAAARMVSTALTESDSKTAIAASKDIMDRVLGRAVERHDNTHRFANVDEKELDAILVSQIEELKDVGPRSN
jgi:hypothetical protein